MEVILDELTPIEFFTHGGIVKIEISEPLVSECSTKKKYTFFDYKEYTRFFRNLYMIYLHTHPDKNSIEVYKYVNNCVKLNPLIGNFEYVVDLDYDNMNSYETAKFYYSNDRREPEVSERDPYGIKNVCFSQIKECDPKWNEYARQRMKRGFDNSELWCLDGTISKFIYPRLKAFKERVLDIGKCPSDIEFDEWKEILEKMVKGFELLSLDRIKTIDEEQIEQEALDLFINYYFALWI